MNNLRESALNPNILALIEALAEAEVGEYLKSQVASAKADNRRTEVSEWLSADSCAELLDLRTRKGGPNRRAFLERYACRPSFPAPIDEGKARRWKRSEVLIWADDERKIQARRRSARHG